MKNVLTAITEALGTTDRYDFLEQVLVQTAKTMCRYTDRVLAYARDGNTDNLDIDPCPNLSKKQAVIDLHGA